MDGEQNAPAAEWTFLSNHGHVLVCLSRHPDMRLRDVAQQVGLTERAVQKILVDLEGAGFIRREKVGRRNHYEIHPHQPLRHPLEAHRTVAQLLKLVLLPAEQKQLGL